MLKHEGIPVKLMAGIPFCREIIHQEIKVKKTIILTLLLITALAANGCGNKKNVTDMKDKETTVSEVQQETTQLSTQETTTGMTMDSEIQQEETTEEKELTGTIDEIKDFMFTVTDAKDTPYSFTFDEKPEGLDNVSAGDTVTVKYTGTISEVDAFEGKVISVEKAN